MSQRFVIFKNGVEVIEDGAPVALDRYESAQMYAGMVDGEVAQLVWSREDES
jgi:hypothetical protein